MIDDDARSRWPRAKSRAALPGARGAVLVRGTVIREKQRDVLAGARPARAARRRARLSRACSSRATGSTPGFRARSRARSSAAIGPPQRYSTIRLELSESRAMRSRVSNLVEFACKCDLRTQSSNEVHRRPLPGNRAQGKEPPVVRRPAGAQPPRGDGGPRRRSGPRAAWAGSRWCSAPTRLGARCAIALSRVFGIGNFARAGRAPLDIDAIAAADPRRPRRRRRPSTFRVSARRADKRFPLTSPQIEREVGGRIKEARGWTVEPRQPGAHDSRRGADRRGVLLLRQGARAPAGCRSASSGTRRVPALGRHRLAGRGVADDAPRLPRAVRPLPQLPDPVARVAGKGARAGDAAHALPVPLAAVPRAVRRDPAAGRARGAAAAAGRDLPPADDAHRRADRAARTRAGAGHRRSRRPGRVADAREHGGDRQRGRRCRCCGRSSAWTRKRSPRRRSGSAPIRSRSSRTRTAARCSRRGTRRRKRASGTRSSARRRRCRSTRSSTQAVAAAVRGGLRVSRYKMTLLHKGETIVKITPGKLAGMKAVSDDARRHRRRGHGSARLAAEVAGQGKGRRRRRQATWRSSRSSSPKC